MNQSKARFQGREVYSKGEEMPSGSSQHKKGEWQVGGGTKGIMVLGGGQSRHWMVVIIQVSVSGSICQFLQILCLL